MEPMTSEWIESVALELLGGARMVLRLPPRIGKTHLANALANTLGETAFLVDGTSLTDPGQPEFRQDLESRIRSTVETRGSAQLIFDSFDQALRLSQGPRLQALLTNLTVDSDIARDVGALFTARCSTELHRSGAGSPLMSRVRPVNPPRVASAVDNLDPWFGDSACLIEQSIPEGSISLADRLEFDQSYLDDVRKAASVEIRAGAINEVHTSYAARSAVHGLITNAGPTYLFNRLRNLLLADPIATPGWPTDDTASAEKFSALIGDARSVIWSDRYMYRDIEPLRRFLRRVVGLTGSSIQLLGASSVSDRQVSKPEIARLTSIPNVDARFITSRDYPDLHERHLYVGPGGWVVPQVHVLVGTQRVGNAAAAPISSFDTKYNAVWRRSLIPQT